MVPEPLKFRCDRCGQLLGVSPSRAGRSVKCPKCGAPLIVPSPGDRPESTPVGSASPSGQAGAPPRRAPGGGAAVGSPGFFDGIDLDPDDLRALFPTDSEDSITLTSGSGDAIVAADQAAGPPGESPPSPPVPDPVPREPIETTDPAPVFSFEPDSTERQAIADGPRPIRAGTQEGGSAGIDDIPMPRVRPGRDVVMPRVAVVAWSLFVLLALFVSFAAGLLAGHFVWVRPE